MYLGSTHSCLFVPGWLNRMRDVILLHHHLKYHMAQASVRLTVTYASRSLVLMMEVRAIIGKKT
jgi:hypothetical protein